MLTICRAGRGLILAPHYFVWKALLIETLMLDVNVSRRWPIVFNFFVLSSFLLLLSTGFCLDVDMLGK